MNGSAHLATDVLVVGAGLGGIAAALAAAETGATVVLTEELHVIGGQLTAQAVCAPDEHPDIEAGGATRSYLTLRKAIRAAYGGRANPGGGWVSRLCCEPAVAERVLRRMLAPHIEAGRIVLRTGVRPVSAQSSRSPSGDQVVQAVEFEGGEGDSYSVAATVVIDATELGDLLPLTGTPWVIGSEGTNTFGEAHALPGGPDTGAEQSATWCALVEWVDNPPPVPPAPPGYAELRDSQPFTLAIAGWDGTVHQYRMKERGPGGTQPFWTYRRLRDGSQLGGNDIAVINWAGNDCRSAGFVASPREAAAHSRALTLAFVHWLRTEAPRDDGGFGYPEIVLCPGAAGTPDGLALAPYIRESRRLRIEEPLTLHDLMEVPGTGQAVPQPTSIAVAWYHADVHARVGHPASVYAPTGRFQIPARCFVSPATPNLIMGAKDIAATQMAAAATRVHPAEWGIGESAGGLAARALAEQSAPYEIVSSTTAVRRLQEDLVARGAPIAWTPGTPNDDPGFATAQVRALTESLHTAEHMSRN